MIAERAMASGGSPRLSEQPERAASEQTAAPKRKHRFTTIQVMVSPIMARATALCEVGGCPRGVAHGQPINSAAATVVRQHHLVVQRVDLLIVVDVTRSEILLTEGGIIGADGVTQR